MCNGPPGNRWAVVLLFQRVGSGVESPRGDAWLRRRHRPVPPQVTGRIAVESRSLIQGSTRSCPCSLADRGPYSAARRVRRRPPGRAGTPPATPPPGDPPPRPPIEAQGSIDAEPPRTGSPARVGWGKERCAQPDGTEPRSSALSAIHNRTFLPRAIPEALQICAPDRPKRLGRL